MWSGRKLSKDWSTLTNPSIIIFKFSSITIVLLQNNTLIIHIWDKGYKEVRQESILSHLPKFPGVREPQKAYLSTCEVTPKTPGRNHSLGTGVWVHLCHFTSWDKVGWEGNTGSPINRVHFKDVEQKLVTSASSSTPWPGCRILDNSGESTSQIPCTWHISETSFRSFQCQCPFGGLTWRTFADMILATQTLSFRNAVTLPCVCTPVSVPTHLACLGSSAAVPGPPVVRHCRHKTSVQGDCFCCYGNAI